MDLSKIRTYKSSFRLYTLSLFSALGWSTMGYAYAIFNATFTHLIFIMDWPSDQIALRKGLTVGLFPAGAIITLILTIYKFSKSRRRALLIFADILTIIGASLTLSSQFWIFLAGRIFLGFGNGINSPIVPVFIRENAPPEISGKMGGSVGICTTWGILLAFALSFGLPMIGVESDYYWRILFFFPGFFSLIRIASFLVYFKDDTPKYYMIKDRNEKANQVIRKIYKEEAQENVLKQLESEKNNETKVSIKSLVNNYPDQLRICVILASLIQLTGVNTITAYSTAILTNSLDNSNPSYLQIIEIRKINILIGSIRFATSVFGGFLLGRIGRKTLLIIGSFLVTISLLLLGFSLKFHLKSMTEAMLLIFSVGISISFGLVNNIYYAEVLPSQGCSLMMIWENLMNVLINFSFPLLANIQGFGISGTVFLMGGISLFGLVLIIKFALETKGYTMYEIYEMFQKNKTKKSSEIGGRQVQPETELA